MPDDAPRHARTTAAPPRAPFLVLTAVLTAVASAATAMYLDLDAQMEVSTAQDLVLVTAPPAPSPTAPGDPYAGRAMNIVLMGTDIRDAENAALAGEADGMRSDSTMLVHVSGDRTWVEVVSIPRDSLVDVPECRLPDGSTSRAQYTMFNEAFSIGAGDEQSFDHAAACTIGTIMALTGVPVTNHVVVRMTGVIDVVQALDGVRMCLPEPVDEDPRFGDLHLPAGEQRLDGFQAIGFLRVRKGTGMGLELGSDLARIARQQALVQSVLRELLGKDVLGDADELYRVVRAGLGAVRPDPDLGDPLRLAAFGYSLRGLDRSRIVFTDLPVTEAPTDRYRVVWTSAADEIWQRLAADVPPPALQVADPAAGDGAGGSEAGAGTSAGDGGTSGGEAGVPGADADAPGDAGEAPGGTGGAPVVPGVPAADEVLPGVCVD